MKRTTLLTRTLAASIAMAALMALAGCGWDHDDHRDMDHHDDHPDMHQDSHMDDHPHDSPDNH